MSKTAIEVITSVQRRRRWSAADKERLVAASLEPGSGVSAVAREAGIHPSQLYGWRRQLCRPAQQAPAFAAVQVTAEPSPASVSAPGMIEIEFANGSRMRVSGVIDAPALAAMVTTLASVGRRR
jgi:transposase